MVTISLRITLIALSLSVASVASAFVIYRALYAQHTQTDSDFDARKAGALRTIIVSPFPDPTCPKPREKDSGCAWGKIGLALVLLRTNDSSQLERGNQLLREALKIVTSVLNRELSATGPGETFSFLTSNLLLRALLETEGRSNHSLAPDIKSDILEVFARWGAHSCVLKDAHRANITRPRGSENIDIMYIHTCWAAAELLKNQSDSFLEDGSTWSQQYVAWTEYLKTYTILRSTTGLAVEFFSPTYSKYFLGVFYNLFDFSSDPTLRDLAGKFISLWWGVWSTEQVDSKHGGSKTRFYHRLQPDREPLDSLPWLYTGMGQPPTDGWHPAYVPIILSKYRLPAIIQRIATGRKEPSGEESWTRQIGMATARFQNGRYNLATDLAISRYAFATRSFVMGAAIVPKIYAEQWAAISSQNRWSGVVFAAPEERIYVTSMPVGGRSNYNALAVAQSRSVQIVQRLDSPYSHGAGPVVIWAPKHLNPVFRGGWIFFAGGGYAAVRPVLGGVQQGSLRGALEPQIQSSPIILHAAEKSRHASFQAFQDSVLSTEVKVDDHGVVYCGLDSAGCLRVYFDARPAEIDGKPLMAPRGWTIFNKYIRQKDGDPKVSIEHPSGTLILDFSLE